MSSATSSANVKAAVLLVHPVIHVLKRVDHLPEADSQNDSGFLPGISAASILYQQIYQKNRHRRKSCQNARAPIVPERIRLADIRHLERPHAVLPHGGEQVSQCICDCKKTRVVLAEKMGDKNQNEGGLPGVYEAGSRVPDNGAPCDAFALCQSDRVLT